jgi:type IV pilus secretin PilQ/predicted competence protein
VNWSMNKFLCQRVLVVTSVLPSLVVNCVSDDALQQQNGTNEFDQVQQSAQASNSAADNVVQGGANGDYPQNVTNNVAASGQSQSAPANQSASLNTANVGASNSNGDVLSTGSASELSADTLTDLTPTPPPAQNVAPSALNSAAQQPNGRVQEGVPTNQNAGKLTWIGYNYRKDQRVLDVQLVVSGEPSYRIFQEVNRAGQHELVVRLANTTMRNRIRRDINASEFRSPVAYIRMRTDIGLRYTDVVLTLRDLVQPRILSKKGGVMLSFDIPEHWFAPKSDAQPVATAEIVKDENPGLSADATSSQTPDNANRRRAAYVPDPAADVFHNTNEKGQPLVPKTDSSKELIPSGGENMLQNDGQAPMIESSYTVLGVAQATFPGDKLAQNSVGFADVAPTPLGADLVEDFQDAASGQQGLTLDPASGGADIIGVSAGSAGSAVVSQTSSKKAIRLDFRDAPVGQIIRMIAAESGINFIIAPEVGNKKTSISLKNVPWDVALKAILESNRIGMQEIAPGLVRIDSLTTFAADKDAEDKARQATEALIPTKILVMPLNYAKADDAVKLAQAMLPKADGANLAQKRNYDRFKAQADPRSNAVIVEATPNVLSTIKSLLERLDAQTPQVRIASRLVEVSNDIANGLGVNWSGGLTYDAGRGLGFGSLPFPNSLSSGFAIDPGGATERGGNAAIHFGSINNMLALDLKLRMYETKNKAETLQTQDVVVQDNEKAMVTAGSTDFIQTAAGVGGTGGLQQVDYNLALSVTPHITADGAVQMKLDIRGDSPKKSQGIAAASKSTRQLITTLLKRSGETAVIGGLYSSEVSVSQRSVPILSSIPLIGALFRSTDKADSKKDLLIMVTPTIVNANATNAANASGAANDGETLSAPVAINVEASNSTSQSAQSQSQSQGQLQSQGQSQKAANQQFGSQGAATKASQQGTQQATQLE